MTFKVYMRIEERDLLIPVDDMEIEVYHIKKDGAWIKIASGTTDKSGCCSLSFGHGPCTVRSIYDGPNRGRATYDTFSFNARGGVQEIYLDPVLYSKMVNFILVEWEGDLNYTSDLVYVKSETTMEEGVVKEDIVESWDF